MGLFENLFGKKQEIIKANQYFQMLNAYTPVFHNWSGAVYESELVRASIDARARHISKLKAECIGSAKPVLQTKLSKAPNSFQTWSQFLYRTSTILDANNTAFIVPVENDAGEMTGIYPLFCDRYELVEYRGIPFIKFIFFDGKAKAIELAKVGILTKFQYKSDFFGENNRALDPTMELIDIQNQAIEEGVKSAATFRFMAQYNNFSKGSDATDEMKRFTESNLKQGGGILLFPNTYSNIKQIESKPFVIATEERDAITKNVARYFGVNDDILTNAAFGDKWSAFYEGAIEPFAIQFSEVVTKMLFTPREIADGTKIMLTSNRLQYMSNADKLNFTSQMADRGALSIDEIREIWNLPPLADGKGSIIPIRGEYYDLNEGKGDINAD